MPRFAANLSMLFNEVSLLERFDRAAAAGFNAIEFLFPYDEDIAAIKEALNRNNLKQILFNLPAGKFGSGERGFANNPARVQEFRDGVNRALEIAAQLDVPQLNCLVGLTLDDVPYEKQIDTLCENLAFAAEQTQAAGIRQLVEPLNPIDTPGFILPTSSATLELFDRIGHKNLWLQYDFYHQQRVAGNLTAAFREYLPRIAHVQIADSPARHQPGTGEINYPFVFQEIDDSGYEGWVSLEYRPLGTTEESLAWMKTS